MKRIILFAAVVLGFVACSKEENPTKREDKGVLTIGAVIDDSETKTSIDAAGKVAWVLNDTITVTDGTNTGKYLCSSIDENNKKIATFTLLEGSGTFSGTITATYKDVNKQVYDGTLGSNCPMEATATVTTGGEIPYLHFRNTCGVLRITLGSSAIPGDTITKILVRVGALSSTQRYRLTMKTPLIISGETKFDIALPACNDAIKVSFYTKDNKKFNKQTKNSIEIKVNQISPATFSNLTPDPVSNGQFSVSATKKVTFAPGLLYWDASEVNNGVHGYGIEEDQFICKYAGNFDPNHINHFLRYYWNNWNNHPYELAFDVNTMWPKRWICNDAKVRADPFCNHLFNDYRILTYAETRYLIDTRKLKDGGVAYNKSHITTQDKSTTPIPVEGDRRGYGLIVYPDDYTGNRDEDTVEEIEACGALFIPCSGYRNWKVPDQALIANDGLGYFMFYSETSATESFCFGYSTELYKTYFEYHEMNTRPGLIRLAKDVVPAAE